MKLLRILRHHTTKTQVKYLLLVLLLVLAVPIPALVGIQRWISIMPGEKAEDALLSTIYAGQSGSSLLCSQVKNGTPCNAGPGNCPASCPSVYCGTCSGPIAKTCSGSPGPCFPTSTKCCSVTVKCIITSLGCSCANKNQPPVFYGNVSTC